MGILSSINNKRKKVEKIFLSSGSELRREMLKDALRIIIAGASGYAAGGQTGAEIKAAKELLKIIEEHKK